MDEYISALSELSQLDSMFDPEVDYDPDFQESAYNIVEKFKKYKNPNSTILPILECFERQPTSEFGIHAELFSFIESLDIHLLKKETLESIKRKPVPQTVWLLKQFINGEESPQKEEYIKLLNSIAFSETIDEETRATAKMFL